MEIVWNDKTSYGQRSSKREFRVLHANICGMEVSVHKHIYYEGWLVSCEFLNIDKHELKVGDVEDAKRLAIQFIKSKLAEFRTKVDEMIKFLEE